MGKKNKVNILNLKRVLKSFVMKEVINYNEKILTHGCARIEDGCNSNETQNS